MTLLSAACANRTVEEKVLLEDGIHVTFRSQTRGGKLVDRGFQQPASISPQRMAIILEAIEIRDDRLKEGQRQQMGAFSNELIGPLAKVLVQAYAMANEGQEIVVQAVRRQSRLKLFNEKYLTSFVTYMQGDSLYFHLSRIEWEIPKKRGSQDKGKLPSPHIGDDVMPFSTLTTMGVYKVGPQAAAVQWRDPMFARPLPVKGSGRQRTRTILDSMPVPADERPVTDTDGLSAEKLRALADLEEARAAGEITEAEYIQRRHRLIGK